MITLNATLEGDKELSRRLIAIPQNIGSFKQPLFKIGREVRISADANFASRGALFGARWKPRKDNNPWPILEKTGKMRRAFDQDLGFDYVAIGNTSEVFKYHQSNAPRSSQLPRRIMLKLDEIRKLFIVKAFQEHIRNSLR
jgi:phage gpG-like protein